MSDRGEPRPDGPRQADALPEQADKSRTTPDLLQALEALVALSRIMDRLERFSTRESFLLGVIGYLNECDHWYLEQAPEMSERLRAEFAFDGETR